MEEIELDEEMDCPCLCEVCGKNWFDLEEGKTHPRKENLVICGECADRIQIEVDNEEEIEDLLSQLSDAEYTVKECKKQLNELGHKTPDTQSSLISALEKEIENDKEKLPLHTMLQIKSDRQRAFEKAISLVKQTMKIE